MLIKKNEATEKRPQGERIIDAPYVFVNFSEYINQVKGERSWIENDRNAITVFKTERYSMVVVCLHVKAICKQNLVDGIFSIQLVEGIIRITTPDEEFDMLPGQIVVFHSLIDHSIEAKTDASMIFTTISDC